MNGKIKLNKIPPNDLLPYNYVSGLPSELQTILSPTTRDLMKKSEDLRHKHVCGEGKLLVLGNSTETENEIYDDVEQNENGERKVNEFGGSFEDYNVVIEKFISRAIHHGHERYHHETLILDASLTHVCFMNSIFFFSKNERRASQRLDLQFQKFNLFFLRISRFYFFTSIVPPSLTYFSCLFSFSFLFPSLIPIFLASHFFQVPVYSHLKIQPTTSICTNYDLIAKQKLVRLESLEELNDMNYVSQL